MDLLKVDLTIIGSLRHAVMPQANFLQKITFDMLYTNGFLIRICSRTLSISSECNTIWWIHWAGDNQPRVLESHSEVISLKLVDSSGS